MMGPNKAAQPTSTIDRPGIPPWQERPGVGYPQDPDTNTTTPTYPYYENVTGRYSPEGISQAEIDEIRADVADMVELIITEKKIADEQNDQEHTKALESRLATLNSMLRDQQKVSRELAEQIKKELKELPEYSKLEALKKEADELQLFENADPEIKQREYDKFNENAAKLLGAKNTAQKEQVITAGKDTERRMNEINKEKSTDNLPKPGFWQVFMVNIMHVLHIDSYERVKNFLARSGRIKSSDLDAFITKYFKSVSDKHQQELAKKTKKEPEQTVVAAETTTIGARQPEPGPLPQVREKAEKTAVETTAPVRIKPEQQAGKRIKEYGEMRSVRDKNVLNMIKGGVENPTQAAINSTEAFLKLLETEDETADPRTKMNFRIKALAQRIQRMNVPMDEAEADRYLDELDPGKMLPETKYSINTFEAGKAAVHDMIAARRQQLEEVSSWLDQGEARANAKGAQLPEAQYEDEVQKGMATCFIDKVIAKREELGMFATAALYNDPDQNTTKELLHAAVEAGAVRMVLHENKKFGTLTPALIVDDFQDIEKFISGYDNKKAVQDKLKAQLPQLKGKIDAHMLLMILNGQTNIHQMKPGEGPSGWYMHGIGVIVAEPDNDLQNAYGNPATVLQRERIIAHEIQHAVNQGLRVSTQQLMRERSQKVTIEGVWGQELVADLTAAVNTENPKLQMAAEEVKAIVKEYIGTADINTLENKYLNDERLSIVVKQIKSSTTEKPGTKLEKSIAGLKKINVEAQKDLATITSTLDEVTAQAQDMIMDMALGDVGINEFNQKNSEHVAVLGMIRMFNALKRTEMQTSDFMQREQLETARIALAEYLPFAFNNFRPNSSELIEVLIKAKEDKDHILHPVMNMLQDSFGPLSIDYFVSNLVGSVNRDLEESKQLDVAAQGDIKNLISQFFKIDPDDETARQKVLTEIINYFPAGTFPESLFRNKNLTADILWVGGLGYDPDELELATNLDPDHKYNGLGIASNPRADIRWTATAATDAFYWGKTPKWKKQGDHGLGGKLDFFMNYKHPKDWGNPLLKIGGINHKVLMDGFGFGLNKYRMDPNDRLEAWSYVTGIPFHRYPFLNNLQQKMELKPFTPKGILDATPNMYSYHVLQDIYGRLAMEHSYDSQSMIRLITEFGGFDYDLNGQPAANMKTYSTKDDDYRLNTQLAEFIEKQLNSDGKRADLTQISERLKGDKILIKNGDRYDTVAVEYKRGYVIKAGYDLDKVLGDETKVAEAIREGNIIQKGRLKLGQMTDNLIQEITEIMWINENPAGNKPFNPLGRAANLYEGKQDAAWGDLETRKQYMSIAQEMMKEDAKKRAKGESFTMSDLYEEQERMQAEPQRSLYNDDGTENKNNWDRYTKPMVKIGDESFELSVAKKFFMEFSLARSKKILSVGVWGKVPDYHPEEDGPYKGRNKDYLDDIIDPEGTNRHDHASEFAQAKAEVTTNIPATIQMIESGEYKRLPGNPDDKGYFFSKGDEIYFLEIDDTSIYRGPQIKGFFRVNKAEKVYSKKGKLQFVNKINGFVLPLEPIDNLSTEKLKRYFGETTSYEVMDKDGKPVEVTAHKEYSTNVGVMFDDVYDSITKIKQGRDLSYRYSIKLNQISTYREYCKIKREFYDGLAMLDSTARNAIIAMTLLGALVPGLAVLANPALLCGMIVWSLGVSPFFQRGTKGWATRELAAIQAQGKLGEQGQYFWRLTDEDHPPSFGELDIARGVFESVKWDYRFMCKSMTAEAKWDTNIITDLFGQLWPKVSANPF